MRLTADNITVTGANKGALSVTGNTRTLAISNFTVANGKSISVILTNPPGFSDVQLTWNVTVYKVLYAFTAPQALHKTA